jgi:hypothetical protein
MLARTSVIRRDASGFKSSEPLANLSMSSSSASCKIKFSVSSFGRRRCVGFVAFVPAPFVDFRVHSFNNSHQTVLLPGIHPGHGTLAKSNFVYSCSG